MLHRALVHSSVISRWPPMLRRFPLMVYRLCPPRAIPARFSFRFEPLDRRKGTRVAVTRRRRSRLPRFRSSVSRGPSTVRQDASSRRDAPSSIPPRRRGHTRAYVHGTNPIFFFPQPQLPLACLHISHHLSRVIANSGAISASRTRRFGGTARNARPEKS